MSFINRTYTDIVQDVLTTLTSGVSQERHTVNYDPNALPLIVPDIVLKRRPVKRVSYVSGLIETTGDGASSVPYTFTLNDYALIPDEHDREAFNTIRFLPFGNKPAPGTDVVVNYYPRNADPAVVTDLNVGSVIRTLVEALSKELAILYTQLNLAYDSGFLETAKGSSLDRVVALLGADYERFRAGRPVGTVRFSRRTGSTGNITIPVGTPITDITDKIRYETVETHTMLAGESTAEVRVRGATQKTPPVGAGILIVIQKSIAGVDSVTNDRPTTRANDDESDQELRDRARGALLASNKGTVDAIRFGLLQMPEVRDVKLEEMPNGVPGEIRLSVSLNVATPPRASLPNSVLARIEELRPAGIRVIGVSASSVPLQAQVNLVLAGSHLAPAEIEQVHAQARKVISGSIEKLGVGQKIRLRPLVAAILNDQRIVDASVSIGQKGAPPKAPGEDFQPPPDAALKIDENDVAFGPDTFDQPLTAAGQPVKVEVRAVLAAKPVSSTPLDSVKTEITNKLNAFFSSLTAGTEINAAGLLTALRDDAKYGIDPLSLQVTLTTAEQGVQIAQGGRAFQVQPNQTFTVVSVEVTAWTS